MNLVATQETALGSRVSTSPKVLPLYLVMGQGDDGDYMKDGKLSEALYRSEDGVNFSFVEETADDTPEQAG